MWRQNPHDIKQFIGVMTWLVFFFLHQKRIKVGCVNFYGNSHTIAVCSSKVNKSILHFFCKELHWNAVKHIKKTHQNASKHIKNALKCITEKKNRKRGKNTQKQEGKTHWNTKKSSKTHQNASKSMSKTHMQKCNRSTLGLRFCGVIQP